MEGMLEAVPSLPNPSAPAICFRLPRVMQVYVAVFGGRVVRTHYVRVRWGIRAPAIGRRHPCRDARVRTHVDVPNVAYLGNL